MLDATNRKGTCLDQFPLWKLVHLDLGIVARYAYQWLVVDWVDCPCTRTVQGLRLRIVRTRELVRVKRS